MSFSVDIWNTIVNKLTATKTKIERSRLNMGVISRQKIKHLGKRENKWLTKSR